MSGPPRTRRWEGKWRTRGGGKRRHGRLSSSGIGQVEGPQAGIEVATTVEDDDAALGGGDVHLRKLHMMSGVTEAPNRKQRIAEAWYDQAFARLRRKSGQM